MLVVRGDEPSGYWIIRVVPRIEHDAEVDDMGTTVVDVRIFTPRIVAEEQRVNVARAAGAPALVTVSNRCRSAATERRCVNAATMAAEEIEVVFLEEKRRESAIGLGELPGLDLRHDVE